VAFHPFPKPNLSFDDSFLWLKLRYEDRLENFFMFEKDLPNLTKNGMALSIAKTQL
jgi:hypothetical protein